MHGTLPPPHKTPSGRKARSRNFISGLYSVMVLWRRRARQRRRLGALDDRALTDIGLNRAQARAEAAKPFWKK